MGFEPIVFQNKPARTTPITAAALAHLQSQYTAAMADLAHTLQGDTGRKFRAVGCAIRNTGSGFAFIDDAGHDPVGFDTISQDATTVTLGFSFTATKVVSLVVTPDETLARLGYTAGASVGLDEAVLQFGQPGGFHDYVQYNGTAWVSSTGFITGVTMNGTTGLITFSHANVQDPLGGIVQLRSAGLRMSQEGQAAGSMSALVYPYNSATSSKTPTTDMRFWIYRPGTRPVPPTELVQSGSNLWVQGILEVA